MGRSAEVTTVRDVMDVLARDQRLEIEADLRIDSPFGPLHLRTDAEATPADRNRPALVIGIDGWGSLLRMSWSALFGALRPGRSYLRSLATATGSPVYLDPGRGPRIRIAGR